MILLAGMNIVFCTVNGTCTGEVTRKPMVEWSRSRPFSIQQNQDYLKILVKDSGKASESLNYFCQYKKVLEQSSEISRLWFSVTLRMFLPVLVKRCVVNARFWQQKGKKDICSSRSGELHYCVCVCACCGIVEEKLKGLRRGHWLTDSTSLFQGRSNSWHVFIWNLNCQEICNFSEESVPVL